MTDFSPLNSCHLHIQKERKYLEEEERQLYFNNLLHIHQHTFLKYMIQLVIEEKNQKKNMSAYNIPLYLINILFNFNIN